VRELQNEIERAVALAGEGETLTTAHLSLSLTPSPEGPGKSDGIQAAASQSGERSSAEETSPVGTKISLQDAREAYEARYITQVLAEHGGNVSHAAVALRLSRVALQKKMKRYQLR
jgi:DNA-binding NtrC family response regulator